MAFNFFFRSKQLERARFFCPRHYYFLMVKINF